MVRIEVNVETGEAVEVALTDAEIAALPSAAAAYVPASITRRQCAIEMRARGMISSSEAIAMVATATPPAFIEAVFVAMPEPDQTAARIDFAAGSYERGNPLLVSAMSASGASAADIDEFFRAAAQR